MTPELQELIVAEASEADMRAAATRDGTTSLAEAGLAMVAAGVTTPEEVLRVAAPEGHSSDSQTGSEPDAETQAALRRTATGACAGCGQDRSAQWKFCPHCGEDAPEVLEGPVAVVCDDDPICRQIAARALSREFPRIISAESAQEALDRIALETPDLLVIDQMMPGMTSVEAIRRLRGQLETAGLPILMLTSESGEVMETESLQAGADDYLQKPISPTRLRARAKAVLAAKRRYSLRE